MAIKFNPLTGNFDFTGSGGGGGGSAFFAGEAATYADLPLDGTAALNSRWLVRSASGVWPFPGYHQGGIYVRVSTAGVDRATDYLLADTNFPDVFSDAAFTVYDDADSTRSMQIEVTDNETLTFKVTGTDSVVRSVAFALSAIVLAALMASSAIAQNIGLVSDTNGNIVTRRTNELTFTNNLRFTPLTNANSRTAIIGTNGALTAGNPPSAAADNGALLTADGAGSSSFVVSRTVTKFTATNESKTSWTNNTVTAATNASAQIGTWVVDANATYAVDYLVWFASDSTNSAFAASFVMSQPIAPTRNMLGLGVTAQAAASFIGSAYATNTTAVSIPVAAAAINQSNSIVTGRFIFRSGANAGTMAFHWTAGANVTNTLSLVAGTTITVNKLAP